MRAGRRRCGPRGSTTRRRGGSRARAIAHIPRRRSDCRAADAVDAVRTAAPGDAGPCLRHVRDAAAAARADILAAAAAHHVRWLALSTMALVASGVFVLVPGPNLIAYYFAFRVLGHFFSWRGARRAAAARWDFLERAGTRRAARPRDLPREARASRVDAIAARLCLRPRPPSMHSRAGAVIIPAEASGASPSGCSAASTATATWRSSVAGVGLAQPGDLTFVAERKYLRARHHTARQAVILADADGGAPRPACAVLRADSPVTDVSAPSRCSPTALRRRKASTRRAWWRQTP